MADHTITGTKTTTQFINTTDETWQVTKNATINVNDSYGISEGGSGNTITVLGTVKATGSSYDAIRFQGATSTVNIGGNGFVNGSSAHAGIQYDGAGGHININGAVKSGEYGVHCNLYSHLTLGGSGTITGGTAVWMGMDGGDIQINGKIDASIGIDTFADGTLISVGTNGQILASDTAVSFNSAGESTLINHGLINGGSYAVYSADDNLDLINTGKIVGTIILGAGTDVLDSRGGTFTGKAYGGTGDDTFYVSQSNAKIFENSGEGTSDTIYSTVDFTIRKNVEYLRLLGTKDIDGTGIGNQDDSIYGNAGDNHLFGKGGNDTLGGNKGNDFLTGGAGADHFIYNAGYGVDHITDFEDNVDSIVCGYIPTEQDFDDLKDAGKIKNVHGDVVIDFGGGDKLIIDGITKADISYDDFV